MSTARPRPAARLMTTTLAAPARAATSTLTVLAAIPRIAKGLAARGLRAGVISPQTGRAVAP
jgi:hypothetical protein